MTSRFDICTPRPGQDGKTRWLKIGVMFPSKDGEGFSIKLDALPIANEKGEIWIKAFVPKERDDTAAARLMPGGELKLKQSRPPVPSSAELDDAIPF